MAVINIAIDGPSGAGKSTISKILARRLGFTYVDTGAIYRAIGLYMERAGVDCRDETAVSARLGEIKISVTTVKGSQRTLLNGEDVSREIRRHAISTLASQVSAHAQVRDFLLSLQRRLAQTADCVMDGRDIGTVVLPNADLKIFLTASPQDRAARRHLELQKRGDPHTFEQILADINHRDASDSNRAVAPLRPAPDSVTVDTSGHTLEQSVRRVLTLVRCRIGHRKGELNAETGEGV